LNEIVQMHAIGGNVEMEKVIQTARLTMSIRVRWRMEAIRCGSNPVLMVQMHLT
jgi:hypothetical protein